MVYVLAMCAHFFAAFCWSQKKSAYQAGGPYRITVTHRECALAQLPCGELLPCPLPSPGAELPPWKRAASGRPEIRPSQDIGKNALSARCFRNVLEKLKRWF